MADRKLATMPVPKLEKTIEQTRETLAHIAKEAPTAGKGLPAAEAKRAREAMVAKAREIKALSEAAKAELAQRETRSKQGIMARLWYAPENRKNRRPEEND